MANSCHNVNNWCYNCTQGSSNGIIRNSKFYCSQRCYDRVHKKVHFGGVEYRSASTIMSESHSTPHVRIVPPSRIEKKCNYCFDTFDISRNSGIDYGPMWFCCQYHLNLANPRPKTIFSPIEGHMVVGAPISGALFGGRMFVRAPLSGPLIGSLIDGPLIGYPY